MLHLYVCFFCCLRAGGVGGGGGIVGCAARVCCRSTRECAALLFEHIVTFPKPMHTHVLRCFVFVCMFVVELSHHYQIMRKHMGTQTDIRRHARQR